MVAKKGYDRFEEVSLQPSVDLPAAVGGGPRGVADFDDAGSHTVDHENDGVELHPADSDNHEHEMDLNLDEEGNVAADGNDNAAARAAASSWRSRLSWWRPAHDDPLRAPLGAGKLHALDIAEEGVEHDRGANGSSTLTTFAQPPTPPTTTAISSPAACPAPRRHLAVVGWRRTYYVVIYCLTIAFLYADQNLLSPTLSDIAEDFGFDDKQKDLYLGAYISGAFFAIGAPAALVVGYVSDRLNRKWLLFALVLIGEGPCLATLWVRSYWQLFILRMLTGISLGGSLPLAYAMVGDLYSAGSRATVSAAVQLSSGAGIAVGQAIAGFVGPWLGWRAPFVFVAVPATLLAALLAVSTTDPPRGACEEGLEGVVDEGYIYSEKMSPAKLVRLVKTPSNFCVILQGLPGCLPWGIILIYLNDYLAIPSGKGLGTQTATSVVLVNGIGGAVGVVGGGALGQWLYNRNPPDMPTMVGISVLSATVPMYLLLNLPFPGGLVAIAFLLSFLVGVLAGSPGPNVRAILLNVNDPEARGMALALQTVLDDLGKGLGPFIIGLLVQVMDRQTAFNIAVLGWIPCGLLLMACRPHIVKDVADMQQRLQDTYAKGAAELVPQRASDACAGGGPTAANGNGVHPDHYQYSDAREEGELVPSTRARVVSPGEGGVIGGAGGGGGAAMDMLQQPIMQAQWDSARDGGWSDTQPLR